MAISIYQLKPRFQALLRPLVGGLARIGITANQVTVMACVISVALGLSLYVGAGKIAWAWFGLVPLWMFLRMALNAVDGMLAREHGQQSALGGYLNELTDVVSDAALYLPFAKVLPFDPLGVGLVIWLSALSEMTGVLGQSRACGRRYDGPMGKSDRAFVFGALALAVAIWGDGAGLPSTWWVLSWVIPVVALLITWNIVNRVRAGLM